MMQAYDGHSRASDRRSGKQRIARCMLILSFDCLQRLYHACTV